MNGFEEVRLQRILDASKRLRADVIGRPVLDLRDELFQTLVLIEDLADAMLQRDKIELQAAEAALLQAAAQRATRCES
jgi:hypothetical protein